MAVGSGASAPAIASEISRRLPSSATCATNRSCEPPTLASLILPGRSPSIGKSAEVVQPVTHARPWLTARPVARDSPLVPFSKKEYDRDLPSPEIFVTNAAGGRATPH